MNNRVSVKVVFENGNSLETELNGNFADARKYYLGNTFNLGREDDVMTKAVEVYDLTNYPRFRTFRISARPATNTKPRKIVITDLWFMEGKVISANDPIFNDSRYDDAFSLGLHWLKINGFSIAGYCTSEIMASYDAVIVADFDKRLSDES
jgi:hypothetical protein